MNTQSPTKSLLRSVPLLVAAWLCAAVAQAATLQVTGLDDVEILKENVELMAGDVPSNELLLPIYVELLPDNTRKAMAAYGFFEPKIKVSQDTVDDEVVITVDVEAGPPVIIKSFTVRVTGEGEDDVSFVDAQQRSPLRKDAAFISSEYEATKSLLIDAAQAKGYFDFKFVTSAVLVSKTDGTAVVNLVADSGPRFTFGNINFDETIFTESFLNRWAPFKADDPYDAAKLSVLNDNLQNSGYFSSVRVSPQRDEQYGTKVPVVVSLTRQESNQVGIGIGYSTGLEGLRGKLTWGKPLINSAGHSADAEINLSRNSRAVSFAYRIPRENQPLYNYWGIEYGLRDTDAVVDDSVNVSKSFLSRLNFERVRRFSSNWNESLFLRYEREFYNISGNEGTSSLILPGFAYTRKRSKGFPFIEWGQSSTWEFMYGNRHLLSSIDFAKAEVYFKYIRAVTPRNTIIFSFRYGAITTNDFDKLPPSQRFFAGGDRSIRGYEQNSVSPADTNGDPVGGRYLETGTFEYSYRFLDRWSFAAFADIGRAFNNFSTSQKLGGGFGIRWQSPVGPFRLDLARPIGEGSWKDIKVHLSLGPEL